MNGYHDFNTPSAAQNRITTDGTHHYEFDDQGNRIAKFVDNNDNDQLDVGDTDITEYDWDVENRLIEVVNRAAHGGSETQVVDLIYDMYGHRIGMEVDIDGDGTVDSRERYVWDFLQPGGKGNVVFDFVDDDLDGTAEASELERRYLWGTGVDQLFAQEDIGTSPTPTSTTYWTLTDNLGTVRDLVTYNGTSTEHFERYIYEAFGTMAGVTDANGNPLTNDPKTRYQFTAQEFVSEVGLHQYDVRWYDSVTALFVSPDPSGADAENLYRPFGNSPTNYTDPTGLVLVAKGKETAVSWQKKIKEITGGIEVHVFGPIGDSEYYILKPNKKNMHRFEEGELRNSMWDARTREMRRKTRFEYDVFRDLSSSYTHSLITDAGDNWNVNGFSLNALGKAAKETPRNLLTAVYLAAGHKYADEVDVLHEDWQSYYYLNGERIEETITNDWSSPLSGDTFLKAYENVLRLQGEDAVFARSKARRLTADVFGPTYALESYNEKGEYIGPKYGIPPLVGPLGTGVGAAQGLRAGGNVSRIWPKHHPFPKYLGGAADQTLKKIPLNLHYKFHSSLDKWKGGKYARAKTAAAFKDTDKAEIIKDLTEFYQKADNGNYAKYLEDFEQAVRESGY